MFQNGKPDNAVFQPCQIWSSKEPGKNHMVALKHLLRYVAGTEHYGLMYTRGKEDHSLIGYSDSVLVGDVPVRWNTWECCNS
jgi:hypothetical protein